MIDEERSDFNRRYTQSEVNGAYLPKHILPKEEWKLWDRRVGDVSGKTVLECGSGDGRKAVWLAAQGAHVIAVELSPVGVEKTIQRAKLHGLQDRIVAICADCCQLERILEPDSVDIALGFSVLHHLPPAVFGKSLRHVLRPGAHALFFENSDANPLYRLARRIRNDESPNGAPLTDNTVQQFIRELGTGEKVFPRFGMFRLMPKYIFRNSRLFAGIVEGIDAVIDLIPFSRRWSAHMWVSAEKVSDQ